MKLTFREISKVHLCQEERHHGCLILVSWPLFWGTYVCELWSDSEGIEIYSIVRLVFILETKTRAQIWGEAFAEPKRPKWHRIRSLSLGKSERGLRHSKLEIKVVKGSWFLEEIEDTTLGRNIWGTWLKDVGHVASVPGHSCTRWFTGEEWMRVGIKCCQV